MSQEETAMMTCPLCGLNIPGNAPHSCSRDLTSTTVTGVFDSGETFAETLANFQAVIKAATVQLQALSDDAEKVLEIMVDAHGAFFDTPADRERLAEMVGEAMMAKLRTTTRKS